MKTYRLLFILSLALSFTLQSCMKDDCSRKVSYISIEPVYKTLDEIHTTKLVQESPRELVNPGQFYYYNNHIFINERGEGIHVINNEDPSNPLNVNFLSIPGNDDLAIKDGYLYANSYVDLMVIDLGTFEVAGRAESVFEPVWGDISNGNVLVDYVEVPKTEVVDCATYSSFSKRGEDFILIDVAFDANLENVFTNTANQDFNANISGGGTGIGGSMAQFTIMSDFLYAIDETGMELFDLNQPTAPNNIARIDIGWGIETIFPFEDKLFIGSNSGMFIYDNSNPTAPTLLSEFAHARACDPVYVKDDYAYVTLRSGTACQGFNNQLDLIDISELTNPSLVRSFPMDNPHGLSIRDNRLFLCEGDFGVKSFDITDPLVLGEKQLDHVNGVNAFDVIHLPTIQQVVMIIGQDGFYQYSYDADGKMYEISKISIKR